MYLIAFDLESKIKLETLVSYRLLHVEEYVNHPKFISSLCLAILDSYNLLFTIRSFLICFLSPRSLPFDVIKRASVHRPLG